MAFQVVGAKIDLDDLEPALAVPIHIEGTSRCREACTMRLGTMNLPTPFVKTHKDLIGGEDHVFEARGGSDGFDLASGSLEGGTQSLPLPLGLLAIHRNLRRHVWVFLIDDVKVGRRTQQDMLCHLTEMVTRYRTRGKARKTKVRHSADESALRDEKSDQALASNARN